MPKKAGKLTLEESKMTVDLTLNDMTIENANAVLALLLGRRSTEEKGTAEKAPAPDDGIPLFEDTPAAASIPAAAPAPVPVQTPTPVPTPVPAAVPAQAAPQTYTVQQLGQAARPLMENGRQQELIGLLTEFGVQSVAALPENRRADFAARLRAMGGLI